MIQERTFDVDPAMRIAKNLIAASCVQVAFMINLAVIAPADLVYDFSPENFSHSLMLRK